MNLIQTDPMNNLTNQLTRKQGWELLNQFSGRPIFKHLLSDRLFQIIECPLVMKESEQSPDQSYLMNDLDLTWKKAPIFTEVIRVNQRFFLSEWVRDSLESKIAARRLSHSVKFTEEEVINTFMPILRALAQNEVPSFYRINSEKIVLDSMDNIRLEHPFKFDNQKIQASGLNIYQQTASSILQASLLLSQQTALTLLKNQQKVASSLLKNTFSQKIIGIVLLLLDEGEQKFQINFRTALRFGFSHQWFNDLKSQIEGIREKNFNLNRRVLRDRVKTQKKPTTRIQDQTSEQSRTSKYRNGKRLENKNINDQSQSIQIMMKPRKDRLRLKFN